MKEKTKIVTIKRRIKDNMNSETGKLLMLSAYHRLNLYNHGIEYLINSGHGYNRREMHNYLTQLEKTVYRDIYHMISVGVRNEVMVDISKAYRDVDRNIKRGLDSELKVKKFNKYYNTFRSDDRHHSRFVFVDEKTVRFRIAKKLWITINLHERLQFKNPFYSFGTENVKCMSFVHKNRKMYICIVLEVTLKITDQYLRYRGERCGCDLGVRNPIIIFDGRELMHMNFPDEKMESMYRRLNILASHLSEKQFGSNNYYKLLLKMNKLYERMINVRKDWRQKTSFAIVTSYENIVVDPYNYTPAKFGGARQRQLNRKALSRAMFLFTVTLKHMSEKYDCEFIRSEPYSSRKCSRCGNVVEKMKRTQTEYVCFNCGLRIDRDYNAAINCYNQSFRND